MKLARELMRSAILAVIALVCLPIVTNAILVAPHALFIDHRQRTGQLTLANPGNKPEEVEIDFMFGYPTTDSLGDPYVELIEDPGPEQPSAAEWMQAFPRRLRLEPGERQVVRLLASPPANLADGEHWSRVIVTSRQAMPMAVADSGLSAGITIELQTIISLAYRKGVTETGVNLTDLSTRVERDSLVSWIGLQRNGNAAYLGNLRIDVLDQTDTVVRDWSIPIAVYYKLNRRLALPLDGLQHGNYQVRFELSTAREDIPQANILPAASIARSFSIEVR
jgi:hypothetical protein